MKKLLLLLIIASSLALISCKDDESAATEATPVDPIVGTWLSEGSNVPLGLQGAPINARKIVATFNANKSYTVVTTDVNGATTTVTGTYTNSASTNTDALATTGTQGATIYNIVANQSSPSVVATGIYAITGTKLTYEVIQTTPAITGVTAPTPAGGFGSTTINGTKYAIYIQKYVKQ
jgi:hypothetical protein